MASSGVLLPRAAAKFIAEKSRDVFIEKDGVHTTSAKLLEMLKKDPETLNVSRWNLHVLNPKTANEAAVNWVFVADVLNFSFWSENESKKFMIRYSGQEWTGYWSLCAAMNRALDNGVPITSAKFYSSISMEKLREIFKSDSETEMPMMEERLLHLHEAGKVLNMKYNGSFANMIKQSGKSAQKLVEMIVDDIPSFRDVALFENKSVALYKRVQILVADTWACCAGKGLGEFSDIDSITMFADYRIPQALVWFGAMRYSDGLMEKLNKDCLMQNGERQEVEIRGVSIHCVDLIVDEMNRLMAKEPTLTIPMNAVLVDHFLWDYRRDHEQETKAIPFHKVRCVYY
ncbi:hypothetical protein CAPTEDRAFT_5356 [Capitella teleta]|uniref:Queuosine 5'-phosphate N-glycosylase/hydrolase n=1 Tax=Capitella teleta TaxID=283909 RepID=R7TXA3_CAPTE|nr:hypothetical protein CAPTEDRAFT_5356 [Capitella teleta]|eukprot:ELT95610.1 hypothetical protein CAPTEDRAFT_5356 [Capitella teleta]